MADVNVEGVTTSVCATIGTLGFFAFAVGIVNCRQNSVEVERLEPVQTKAQHEGCRSACGANGVRQVSWRECVCD